MSQRRLFGFLLSTACLVAAILVAPDLPWPQWRLWLMVGCAYSAGIFAEYGRQ